MEDLLLAFVTLAASSYILGHLADAGMDAFVIVTFLASLPVVGYLAYERGRSQWRWVGAGVIIGPLAIPMLYFVAVISTFRKMINDAAGYPGCRPSIKDGASNCCKGERLQ